MNDIFLSYASSDRAIAQKFSNALEALGWSVWWDREIPHGKDFDLVIEQELNAARCAIVLWSEESVQSRWVRGEASAAATRGCLIPILIERVTLPLEFRQIQTAELIGWNGNTDDPEFVRLLDSIKQLLGRDSKPAPSPTAYIASASPRRRIVTGAIVVAAIVAIVASFALRNGRNDTESPASSASTSADTEPSESIPSVVTNAEERAPVATSDAMPIVIGDKIREGKPVSGAGAIDTAHEKDVYAFSARAGQNVYFQVVSHTAALASVEWKVLDAKGTEVFRACLGCGHPGVQKLRTGGRYTLIVGSDRDPGVGTYELQLHDVPDPDRFKVAIGDVIGEDKPGPGAGVIESPGVEDIYAFEASPRQRVYVRVREHSTAIASAKVRLLDSNDTPIFEGCLGCGEPGVQVLTKGGAYSLAVGIRNDPGIGTYRLQLFDVPKPDEFAITMPAKIANGVPARGAGLIESPGAEDRYSFEVEAGQQLAFKLGGFDQTLTYNYLRLIAEDGTELFNRCFGCSPPELQTFSRGGRYFLIVGTSRDPATGAYTIEITRR